MPEHIVCTNIMAHLDEHKLLSDRQHAFRKNRSCETQLITVINDWAKTLDAGGQVDPFILDFEKAFDTPPHELLKCKLHGYGISGKNFSMCSMGENCFYLDFIDFNSFVSNGSACHLILHILVSLLFL